MLIAISMRYSKTSGKVKGRNLLFSFSKKDSELLSEVTQLEFIKNSKSQIVSIKEFKVVDCFFETFSQIRQQFLSHNIFDSLKSVENYYKLFNLISEGGGRSSSFVFVTCDNKLVIKTITKLEYNFFKRKLLQNYSTHLQKYEESYLIRIFALLFIKHLNQYVIIMENAVQDKEECIIFDLKGSKVGRFISDVNNPKLPPKGRTLKDINFDLLDYKIKVPSLFREKILKTLASDFLVLKNSKVIDYSLLLCIKERKTGNLVLNRFSFLDLNDYTITIAIIDIFQGYCLCKVCEKAAKSILNDSKQVSSTDPESYFTRISNYLLTIIH